MRIGGDPAVYHELGHVPIIDTNPRQDPALKAESKPEALARSSIGQVSLEAVRYRARSTVERVSGWLNDEFGGHWPLSRP